MGRYFQCISDSSDTLETFTEQGIAFNYIRIAYKQLTASENPDPGSGFFFRQKPPLTKTRPAKKLAKSFQPFWRRKVTNIVMLYNRNNLEL